MRDNFLQISIISIILVALQIWVFSPITLFQVATPIVYPIILLFIPMDWRPIPLTILGFIIGCIIDYFCFTPGLHSSSFSLVSFTRYYLLKLKLDAQDNIAMPPIPSVINERSYVLLAEILILHLFIVFLYSMGETITTLHFYISLGSSLILSMAVSSIILLSLSVRIKPLTSHDK